MTEKKPSNSTNTSDNPPSHRRKRAWLVAIVAVAAVVLLAAATAGYAYFSQPQKIVRNISVGAHHVGGLDYLTALEELNSRWDQFSQQAFRFVYQTDQANVPIKNISTSENEVIIDLATFDVRRSLDAAYDYGHRGKLWQQVWERTLGWLGQRHEVGFFTLDSAALDKLLREHYQKYDQAAVDADLTIDEDNNVTVTPSQDGLTIDYDGAVAAVRGRLRAIDPTAIILSTKIVTPTIVSSPTLTTLAQAGAQELLAHEPLILSFEDKTWTIDQAKLKELIGFRLSDGQASVGLNETKTEAWLETLRPEVDIEPRDAKFSVIDGRVEEFQTSVIGRKINAVATAQALNTALLGTASAPVAMVVDEVKPLTDTVSTNDLGIKELVGEGITDFKGSPTNRRYNIGLGAEKLHGLLIKPGETFSLVEVLTPIDGAHGWKSELVIKGTKITPEYGGGLCQVATTLFRAILNAGLPVLERSNHSLRISYYEPPIGLDATIYEPKPDLKFTNDYATALLLQTRIEGTKLIFSFYGTNDGRTVDLPEPKVWNRVPIPETQYIEVDDLAPGVEECQKPGHPGADALATYTVTKADGTSVTQEFSSHYRAIPVICRVGKQVQ